MKEMEIKLSDRELVGMKIKNKKIILTVDDSADDSDRYPCTVMMNSADAKRIGEGMIIMSEELAKEGN
jgi:hypothetical protein